MTGPEYTGRDTLALHAAAQPVHGGTVPQVQRRYIEAGLAEISQLR